MAEATKVGFQLASSLASKHLTDAEFIKGGYLVIDSLSKITPGSSDYLPVADGDNDGIIVEGSLCYCTADSKFYQYNNGTWAEKEFGTKAEATTTTPGLMPAADKKKLDEMPAITISQEEPTGGNAGDIWFKY